MTIAAGGRRDLAFSPQCRTSPATPRFDDAEMLEALCDVFDVEPGELLEREAKRRRRG